MRLASSASRPLKIFGFAGSKENEPELESTKGK
jgi:hypothetical protein